MGFEACWVGGWYVAEYAEVEKGDINKEGIESSIQI